MSEILLRDFVRVDTGDMFKREPVIISSVDLLGRKELCMYDTLLDGIRDILEGVEQLIGNTYNLLSLKCSPQYSKVTLSGSVECSNPKSLIDGLKPKYAKRTKALDKHMDTLNFDTESDIAKGKWGLFSKNSNGYDNGKEIKVHAIVTGNKHEQEMKNYDIVTGIANCIATDYRNSERRTNANVTEKSDDYASGCDTADTLDDEDSGEEYEIDDWEIDEIIAEANMKEALEAGKPFNTCNLHGLYNYLCHGGCDFGSIHLSVCLQNNLKSYG